MLGALLAARQWSRIGDYPTGNDPGNWIALGRMLVYAPGDFAKEPFPPLVPLVMYLGKSTAGPMAFARAMEVTSTLAVVAAVYFVAMRELRVSLAMAVAAGVGFSAYVNEVSAFGGYPQNFGTAFAVVALWAAVSYFRRQRRWYLIAYAGFLSLTALTHHATFAVALSTIAVGWTLYATERPTIERFVRVTAALGLATLPAVLAFLPILWFLVQAGYQPPINISQIGLVERFQYSAAEAPLIWLWIIAAGASYLVLTVHERRERLWKVSAALLLVGLLLYVGASEVRAFPTLAVGAALAVGGALERLARQVRRPEWRMAQAAMIAAFLVVLFLQSERRLQLVYPYYAVADDRLMETAAWMDAHRDEGAFAVRKYRNDWPVVWWFAALTRAHLVGGADPRLLTFPEQRADAQLVAALFDVRDDPAVTTQIAQDHEIRYMVFRPADWENWPAWWERAQRYTSVAYENDEYVIVDIAERTTAEGATR